MRRKDRENREGKPHLDGRKDQQRLLHDATPHNRPDTPEITPTRNNGKCVLQAVPQSREAGCVGEQNHDPDFAGLTGIQPGGIQQRQNADLLCNRKTVHGQRMDPYQVHQVHPVNLHRRPGKGLPTSIRALLPEREMAPGARTLDGRGYPGGPGDTGKEKPSAAEREARTGAQKIRISHS